MRKSGGDFDLTDSALGLGQRYVEVMNSFAVDLISLSNESELAWYVAREVVQKLGFPDCVIYYCIDDPELLEQVSAIGEKNPLGNVIVNHLKIPVGEGVTGRVAKTQSPLLFNDLSQCDFYIQDVDPAQSELCVPILCHGKVLGVIDSEHANKDYFTDAHLETLKFVASLMAAKLELIGKERDQLDSELRNRLIFNSSLDGIVTVNENGRIVESNKAAHEIFGYEEVDIVGRRAIRLFVPPKLQGRYVKHMSKMLAEKKHYLLNTRLETLARRKNGQEFPLELTIAHYRIGREKFFTGFFRDITARKQAEFARRKALADAEKANRTKSEFLATMSHELRTPLNAIIGFSEVLHGELFGPLGGDRYKEYAEDIMISGRHLLTLVNDILDLSAIEANELTMHKREMHVRNIMHDCSIIIGELAKKKHITYNEILAEDLSQVYADPRAISQILINLLSNAVKFTPDGGEVTVEVTEKDNHHIICVKDTGPGMDPQQLETLTKPFVRGQSDAQTAMEGSGLGLAIVKSLVGLHDGTLSFESAPGLGTAVYVKIPSNQE